MEIKVSVIVPAYNAEKYIEKCLDSIIHQTLREIEVIVIDDGSYDLTGTIVDRYIKKDSRIKKIHQSNKGSSTARNVGLKKAKGEFVGYLDSDDFTELNYYEEMFLYAKKNELEIVVSDFIKENSYKKELKQDLNLEDEKIMTGKEYIENLFLGNGYPNVWDKLVKRSLYIENKIKFEKNIFLGDDIIVTTKLGYFAKRVGKINKAFVHYVQHDLQGTSKKGLGDKIFDLYLVIKNLEEFFIKEKYISINFNWYKMNEFYIKFLSCYPTKTERYLNAKKQFILGLDNILKLSEVKKLKFKHRMRMKLCKKLGHTIFFDKYLKLKNNKNGVK
ncbi:MAG: glycosyltransferase family 2 protein [Fusobacteriaceae bacterium]